MTNLLKSNIEEVAEKYGVKVLAKLPIMHNVANKIDKGEIDVIASIPTLKIVKAYNTQDVLVKILKENKITRYSVAY